MRYMGFTYQIDAVRRLVTIRPEGPPTLADWTDVLDRIARDPAYAPGFGIMSDRRHIAIAPVAEYVRGSIEAIRDRREVFGRSRWAILTSHTASYGMARMAEAFADRWQIVFRVFRDEREAVRWVTETAA